MRRRRTIPIVTVAAVGASSAVTFALLLQSGSPDDSVAAQEVATDVPTASVERRDLVIEYEAVGELAPASTVAVTAPASDAASAGPAATPAESTSTVVSVARPGDLADVGAQLAVVDDQPIVVFDGEIPMWRDLADGDEGPDVEQLERALVDAGFDPDENVTVDEEYTSATAAMVEDWQESIGAPETGRVALGTIVFVSEPMRVESTVEPGTIVSSGETVVLLASESRVAVADVPVADAIDLAVGDAVSVRLPDRTVVDGTATSIVAGEDLTTRRVEIELESAEEDVANLGSVEVDLSWSETVAADVATLPAGAFRRLDSGVYVVDVVGPDGGLDTIVVEPGQQVGSRVEVAGVPLDALVLAP